MADVDTTELDTSNEPLPTETRAKRGINPKLLELTEEEQKRKDAALETLDSIRQNLAKSSKRTNTVDDKRTLEELKVETQRAEEMETPTMDSLLAARYKKAQSPRVRINSRPDKVLIN